MLKSSWNLDPEFILVRFVADLNLPKFHRSPEGKVDNHEEIARKNNIIEE